MKKYMVLLTAILASQISFAGNGDVGSADARSVVSIKTDEQSEGESFQCESSKITDLQIEVKEGKINKIQAHFLAYDSSDSEAFYAFIPEHQSFKVDMNKNLAENELQEIKISKGFFSKSTELYLKKADEYSYEIYQVSIYGDIEKPTGIKVVSKSQNGRNADVISAKTVCKFL